MKYNKTDRADQMFVSFKKKITPIRIEITVILSFLVMVYILSGIMDCLEILLSFLEKYEAYELDELLTTSIFASIALTFFSIRRWREAVNTNTLLKKKHEKLIRVKEEIKVLKGIVPICSGCKQIRDDKGFWQQVDHYIENHTDAKFSHSLCPNCLKEMYGNEPWFKNKFKDI